MKRCSLFAAVALVALAGCSSSAPSDGGIPPDASAPADQSIPLLDDAALRAADAPAPPRGDAASPPTDLATPPADGGDCPPDTVALPGFCIDRYEAPNQPGVRPLAFQTAPDGEAWCQARGKRLCTEAEWDRACQGPQNLPYPYGTVYQHARCNDDKTWIPPNWGTLGTYPSDAAVAEATRLYQADPSGSRAGCASAEGAFDLTGNVAEWVVRSLPHANNYGHVMKGCYWAGCFGGSPPSCSFVNPAHPGTFRTYEGGFRCCRSRP